MERQFFTQEELGQRLGYSVDTLRKWRNSGVGPPFLRGGVAVSDGQPDPRRGSIRYERDSVEAWLKQKLGNDFQGFDDG